MEWNKKLRRAACTSKVTFLQQNTALHYNVVYYQPTLRRELAYGTETTFVHWKGAGTQLPANTGGENKTVMQKKVEEILQIN